MKLLLTAINAKYIHSNLALRSLAAAAPDCTEHLFLKEFTINQTAGHMLGELYTAAPDALFFSCYIWNITYVEELCAQLHKLLPDVPVWLGGPEVSFESERFLAAHPAVKGIMRGAGEDSFCALARHYIYGSPEYLADIPGLVYRENGTIAQTGEALRVPLSKLPFAYADPWPMPDSRHRIVYYESSRGCPFACSYCLSSVERELSFRDVDLVKRELSAFVAQGIPQVKFVDRTFNCNPSHALAVWRHIAGIDRGTTNFHFEISADLLRDEELALLSRLRPGLVQLEIGVQSTNPATLAEIRRHTDLPRLFANVRRILAGGNIHVHLDLIAGLPYEDYGTFAGSFDAVFALGAHQLQLGFLKVLKGSYMYERAHEYGLLFHDRPPYEVLATKWLPFADLLRIKRAEEMLEVYYNSGQFALSIRLLTLTCASAFALFERLGGYYEKNGLFGISHSRLARCEILLDFVREEQEAIDLNMLREALVYDLYARENCKRRPVWAVDLSPYKQTLRALDPERKGSLRHVEPFSYRFPLADARVLSALPERSARPLLYRFDYEARDALTGQAQIENVGVGND